MVERSPRDKERENKKEFRKITRREALSTAGKIAVSVVVTGVIAGLGGYYVGTTSVPPAPPKTVISTVTKTLPASVKTVTSTYTVTVPTTVTATGPTLKIGPYPSEEEMMESFKTAKIDWRQFEGVSIRFIGNREPNQESIGKLVPLFEELTGIKVTYELVEEEELRSKTTTDIVAKSGMYDAMLIDPMYMPKFVKLQGVEDLNKYLNDSSITDLQWYDWPNDFPEGFRKMGMIGDVLVGIPLHCSGTLLFWNKPYFEKYGLDPERPPRTMEELEQFAAQCHHPDEGVYGIAMRGVRGSGLNMFIWACFLKSFCGDWFDENWEPQLTSSEALEAAKFYVKLLRNYGPPGASTYEWSKILALMCEGKVAIVIDTPAFAITIEDPKKSKTVGQWGYAAQPAGPCGPCMDPFSWYVGINSASPPERRKAAWLFIQWMTSKEVQMKIGGPAIYVSRLSVNTDPRWRQYFPWLEAWQKAMTENLKYADPDARPRIPEWPEVGDIAGAALEAAIAGSKSVEEAFAEANERIKEVMRKAGYYG